jgi:hypothetical protein
VKLEILREEKWLFGQGGIILVGLNAGDFFLRPHLPLYNYFYSLRTWNKQLNIEKKLCPNNKT